MFSSVVKLPQWEDQIGPQQIDGGYDDVIAGSP